MRFRVPRSVPHNVEAVLAYLSHHHDVTIRGFFDYRASIDGLTYGIQLRNNCEITIDGMKFYSTDSLMDSIEWIDEGRKEVAYAV